MSLKASYYIGLMSGTSLDGADGVLVNLLPNEDAFLQIKAHQFLPMCPSLRKEFQQLNTVGFDEMHRGALAANALVEELYVPIVQQLLKEGEVKHTDVIAIGAHGQTIRHLPNGQYLTEQGQKLGGYTIQLNAPALLAERTEINVVADFRSRDIAAGGQGAPLVPAFHQSLFAQSDRTIAVLNLGGIANLTILNPDQTVVGFDTGPANVLMDEWIEIHQQLRYDHDGHWAATGQPISELLNRMMADAYFHKEVPKSTGRDHFNQTWLQSFLATMPEAEPEDVQATLLELTVCSIVDALQQHVQRLDQLLVCGGGAYNARLMQRLSQTLNPVPVVTTAEYGLAASMVEATAFAWLAQQCIEQKSGNLPAVTGASGPRILGALYTA